MYYREIPQNVRVSDPPTRVRFTLWVSFQCTFPRITHALVIPSFSFGGY